MKISILNKEFEFNSEEESFENIVYTIFKETSKHNRFIDYLIIDGKPVKINFVEYLEKHFSEIKHITVVALSVKDSIMTSLLGFHDFVREQLLSMDFLISSLSDKDSPESSAQIDLLLEGIAIIVYQYEKIDRLNNLNSLIPNYYLWNRLAVQILKLGNLSADIDYSSNANEVDRLNYIFEEHLKPILLDMDEILTKMLDDN